MTDWEANEKSTYYALKSKAEKRYEHGFSLLTDFTWSKMMTKDLYYTAPAISEKLKRAPDPGDQTFRSPPALSTICLLDGASILVEMSIDWRMS